MTKQVLVIDDDDGIREIVKLSLEAVADWQVLMAASGQAGIVIAQAQQPDLILLDVMMPGEDGVAIFNQLQANPTTQAIPTILLTAKARPSERQELLATGVNGVIVKPFKPRDLVQQIKQLLAW
ncbi:MAG: response regulator [Spirulina sp. SIO3F2]|nr:response regulator [Spirulina sp. SIO3F2]